MRWCYNFCFIHQIEDGRNSWGEGLILFITVLTYSEFLLSFIKFPFFCYHFFSAWRTSFSHSLMMGVLLMTYLVFLHPRMSRFPPHSWRVFFARDLVWSWQFFSFSPWKMLCHFLLHLMVTEKKSPIFWTDSSLWFFPLSFCI